MSILRPSGLENHPAGSGNLNAIINGDWGIINKWLNAAEGVTASQSGTTVTASEAFFTDDNIGDIITFADSTQATITAVGSTTPQTTCTVGTSQTVTSQAFTIYRSGQPDRTMLLRALLKATTNLMQSNYHLEWDSSYTKFKAVPRPGTSNQGAISADNTVLLASAVGLTSNSGFKFLTTDQRLEINRTDAETALVVTAEQVAHNSSGTPAAGFGSRKRWLLETNTTPDQTAVDEEVSWSDATDGNRTSRWQLKTVNAGGSPSAMLDVEGNKIGFFGVTPVVRQGALTGANATALDGTIATNDTVTDNIRSRVNDLENRLQNLGLIN